MVQSWLYEQAFERSERARKEAEQRTAQWAAQLDQRYANKKPKRIQKAEEIWGTGSTKRQGDLFVCRFPWDWDELTERVGKIAIIPEIASGQLIHGSRHFFTGLRVMFRGAGGWAFIDGIGIEGAWEGEVEYPGLPSLTLQGPHLLALMHEDEWFERLPLADLPRSNQRFGIH